MTNYDYSIHYKRYHDGSREDIERMALVYEKLLSPLLSACLRSTKVLDYGCGDGALVHYLSRRFDDAFGVDASKEQIATGVKNGINIAHLPLENFESWCESHAGSYDIVFTFDVLEHVPVADQIEFVRHLAKLLKPGGHFLAKTFQGGTEVALLDRLKRSFRTVQHVKPPASRDASVELYLLAKGFKGRADGST